MTELRPVWIGVSTKAYLGWQASLDWIAAVAQLLTDEPLGSSVRLFVAPSFPVLSATVARLVPLGAEAGAQNVAWSSGALTGEVSAEMLSELGVSIVEVGHAERRALFQEDDEVVRSKTTAVLAAGMTPLLCVGELQKSDPDAAAGACVDQIASAVPPAGGEVMIAYEPVWAIGASEPAEPDYVNSVIRALRAELSARYPVGRVPAAGRGLPVISTIIYGGSAGPGLLGRLPESDGLFLGRFAHDPANLAAVLAEAAKFRQEPQSVLQPNSAHVILHS